MTEVLRFAIITAGTALEAWQEHCVRKLLALDGIHLALRIILIRPHASLAASSAHSKAGFPSIGCYWHQRFWRRATARRMVTALDEFDRTPLMACSTNTPGPNLHDFREADSDVIAQHKLDFILLLDDTRITGKILEAARFGVWAFDFGEPDQTRRRPPGFWEIYHGSPVTSARLWRLTGADAMQILLKEGFLKTIRFSYGRNLNNLLMECAQWPAQVCVDIQKGNAGYLDAPAKPYQAPNNALPSNLEFIEFMVKSLRNLLAEMRDTLFRHGLWNVGIVREPIQSFLSTEFHPHIRYLTSGDPDRFLADPFGVARDGTITMLCEDFDYHAHKGNISSVEVANGLDVDSLLVQPHMALPLPVHASHPYLFEHQGELYCVPETARLREVGLYRALTFPSRWVKIATLLADVAALDTTIFQHDGLWWLTCTDKDQGAHSKLFIWYADGLFGTWQAHAANPVKIDVRSARPAGTPFVYQGKLYRPAQDCSRTYGGAVVINEVTRLTTAEFREQTVAVINPDPTSPYPDGIHTLSAVGNVTLVDGKRLVFKESVLRRSLRRELAKIGLLPR